MYTHTILFSLGIAMLASCSKSGTSDDVDDVGSDTESAGDTESSKPSDESAGSETADQPSETESEDGTEESDTEDEVNDSESEDEARNTDTDEETVDSQTDIIDSDTPEGEECSDEWGLYDSASGLCWQKEKDGEYYDWDEANSFCAELRLGGFDNWRLPALSEIVALLGGCDGSVLAGEEGICHACIDTCEQNCVESEHCLSIIGYEEDYNWTSDEVGEDDAWGVLFLLGEVEIHSKQLGYPLRCVRTTDE